MVPTVKARPLNFAPTALIVLVTPIISRYVVQGRFRRVKQHVEHPANCRRPFFHTLSSHPFIVYPFHFLLFPRLNFSSSSSSSSSSSFPLPPSPFPPFPPLFFPL